MHFGFAQNNFAYSKFDISKCSFATAENYNEAIQENYSTADMTLQQVFKIILKSTLMAV